MFIDLQKQRRLIERKTQKSFMKKHLAGNKYKYTVTLDMGNFYVYYCHKENCLTHAYEKHARRLVYQVP